MGKERSKGEVVRIFAAGFFPYWPIFETVYMQTAGAEWRLRRGPGARKEREPA
jgi:hypothetical protein